MSLWFLPFKSRAICHVDVTCNVSHGMMDEHFTRPGVHRRFQNFLVTFLCTIQQRWAGPAWGAGGPQKCRCICPSSRWWLTEGRTISPLCISEQVCFCWGCAFHQHPPVLSFLLSPSGQKGNCRYILTQNSSVVVCGLLCTTFAF